MVEEYIGHQASGDPEFSIARVLNPAGWNQGVYPRLHRMRDQREHSVWSTLAVMRPDGRRTRGSGVRADDSRNKGV